MIPRKALKTPRQSVAALTFPDFARMDSVRAERSLSGRDAPLVLNFSVRERALSDGPEAVPFAELPEGVSAKEMFVFRKFNFSAGTRDDRLLIRSSDGDFYEKSFTAQDVRKVAGLSFSDRPSGICYRLSGEDVMVFCSAGEGMKVYDGNTVRSVPGAPAVTSLCLHFERLFATVGGERSAVWFSDDLDVTNWDVSLEGAGFIETADEGGAVLAAVSFGGQVYLFRRYAIARLTAYADQTEFVFDPICVTSGRIFERTVCVCGDRILYTAQNGIHAFNGSSVQKILERYDGVIDFGNAGNSAFYAGGKYYLNFIDRSANPRMLVFDVETGEEILLAENFLTVLGADVENESRALVCFQQDAGTIYELKPPKSELSASETLLAYRKYVSKTVTLSASGKRRLVSKFSIETRASIRLKIVTDEGSAETTIPAGGAAEQKCELRGRTLRFEIEADGNGHRIFPPVFEIRSIGE